MSEPPRQEPAPDPLNVAVFVLFAVLFGAWLSLLTFLFW